MPRQVFGDFQPDQPLLDNPGLVVADGCIPIATGYAPFGSFLAASPALPSRCLGGGAYQSGGETYVFVATASDIYAYSADAGFASLATGLTSSQEVGVQFLPYAALMLATNGADPIRKFDPAAPGAITVLGGSPPTARFLAEVRGMVVAGYCSGSALRVAWSDIGLPESWAIGDASVAGVYDMPSGGDITGLVGGEYGLVFQQKRIVRMTFTADAAVWQFDELATNLGCAAPQSLATWNATTFFLSDRGFMMTDGTTVTPIGDEKINRSFITAIDRGAFQAMSAAIDPVRSLYIVSLPAGDPATKLYLYNYILQRWSTVTVTTTKLLPLLVTGASIDDLDAIYGGLDAIPFSLDSAAARGGYPLLLAFDTANRMGGFSGAPVAATFTDGLREAIPGKRARLRSIRPLCDAAVAAITIAGANGFADPLAATTYTVRTSAGVYRTRENWNLMQLSLSIPAGTPWSFAQGYDADIAEGGRA